MDIKTFLIDAILVVVKELHPELEEDKLNRLDGMNYNNLQFNFSTVIYPKLGFGKSEYINLTNRLANIIRTKETFEHFDVQTQGCSLIFVPKMTYLSEYIINNTLDVHAAQLTDTPQNVLVDYSSPNMAKDMHVGHLRSTIIGHTIANMFEAAGHTVHRINHIGDFGTAFGQIIETMREQGMLDNDEYKDTLTLLEIQNMYREGKTKYKTDSEFASRALETTTKLQNNDPEIIEIWTVLCDVTKRLNNSIYSRLGIYGLIEVGESYYQPMLSDIVAELEEKGLIETEESGLKIINTELYDNPLIVMKSDGGFTYDTTDLAAIRHRLCELQMDQIHYVVGSGQGSHFNMIFDVAKRAGWLTIQRVEHIGFGDIMEKLDNGKLVKFSSRRADGTDIRLEDLLNDGVQHAKGSIVNPEERGLSSEEITRIANVVGHSAIKYADLSTTRTQNYTFSFDRMLSLKGNTAVYLLYNYTRINSIFTKAGLNPKEIISNSQLVIEHPKEFQLAMKCMSFVYILQEAQQSLLPSKICDYMYQLSGVYSSFFTECQCVTYKTEEESTEQQIADINFSRLILCELTRRIMKCCFDILGIDTLIKM